MFHTFSSILVATALTVEPVSVATADASLSQKAEQTPEQTKATSTSTLDQRSQTLEESAAKSALAAEKAAMAAESAAQTAAKLAAAFEELSISLKDSSKSDEKTPAPKAAKDSELSKWSGTVGISLISLTGNTNSLTTTANLSLRRESEKWIFQFKADGAYGRTRPTDVLNEETGEYEEVEPETVALNAQAEARGDFRFTNKVALYAAAGSKMDHVNGIESLNYGEMGLSVIWVDQKEANNTSYRLQTDFGFRGGKELRFNYYPTAGNVDDEVIAAPRIALAFRFALTDGLLFTEDLEVLPNVVGDSRVLVTSLSKFSLKVYKALNFTASFLVKHDSNPVDDKKATDTVLTVGLELGF